LVLDNRFVMNGRIGGKYCRLGNCEGFFFSNLCFDNPAVSILELFIISSLLEVDKRAELSVIQVCSMKLVF
jgi:hypothetical protein